MKAGQQILSDLVVYTKYARFLPEKKRRETWTEITRRYLHMLVLRLCEVGDLQHLEAWFREPGYRGGSPLLGKILHFAPFIFRKEVLPSMRACQFAGPAILRNESRIYNCAYLPVDHYKAFAEIMFLLLGGTGVGISVQRRHTQQLPPVHKPTGTYKYLIEDSLEGWSEAVRVLFEAYLGIPGHFQRHRPRFDYSNIRPRGQAIKTAGGQAPGPEPLQHCLGQAEALLAAKEEGSQLSSLEIHDLICILADAVLAGGSRRAALISLFDPDDEEMLHAKSGKWWEQHPYRGRANNSAVLIREEATREDFDRVWHHTRESGAGEPGIFWTHDPDWGCNPCCEIGLQPFQFCNLTTLNGGNLRSDRDFLNRCRAAAFFGTLQAAFTDFHYLRPVWREHTEAESLIGVSITGIGNGYAFTPELLEAGAQAVKEANSQTAQLLDIPAAARCTCIKPEGSTSPLLGVSSGIHAWHSHYFIRNLQCRVGDPLYSYFQEHHPALIKVMDQDPGNAVIGIPQKAPEEAIFREEEGAIHMLERVKMFSLHWVKPGHRSGVNGNNVSATVSVREGEWDAVGEWMWQNRHHYNGLAVLPFQGGTYRDAPFVACSREEYEQKLPLLEGIDLRQIEEQKDLTDLQHVPLDIACGPHGCEIL